jgi:hypothetical protein
MDINFKCLEKNYIICGFSGVGKSTAEQKRKNVHDFESSIYSHDFDGNDFVKNEKFPGNYIDAVMEHCNERTGQIYLLSCHQEVRDELKRRGIPYVIVLPTEDQRNEYVKRWLKRGSSIGFIKNMRYRWSEMLYSCVEDDAPRVYLREDEYIIDVLPN